MTRIKREYHVSDELSVDSILGPQGRIARRLDNYEPRQQQLLMARKVAQALESDQHIVAEAGTGTGKSFAYLVPAILHATENQAESVEIGEDDDLVEAFELTVDDKRFGGAQGMVWAFDSLYVVSYGIDGKAKKKNQPNPVFKDAGNMPAGLYRVRDTNNDDKYDSVELLREFKGGGEHGPHAVILSPDKK